MHPQRKPFQKIAAEHLDYCKTGSDIDQAAISDAMRGNPVHLDLWL